MANVENIDIDSLPSLPLSSRKELPEVPAVYLVVDAATNVLYVGQTGNLNLRWSHHDLVERLRRKQGIKIVWLQVASIDELSTLETELINGLAPTLNKRLGGGGRKPQQGVVLVPCRVHPRIANDPQKFYYNMVRMEQIIRQRFAEVEPKKDEPENEILYQMLSDCMAVLNKTHNTSATLAE